MEESQAGFPAGPYVGQFLKGYPASCRNIGPRAKLQEARSTACLQKLARARVGCLKPSASAASLARRVK